MLVSVLIPTYNRAHTLRRAIDSVLDQDYDELECLVIDDASIDNTLEILNQYDDSRLKVISLHENSGVSAARNKGFEQSRGEAIALLDSDDEWLKDKLHKQIPLLQDYPLVHGEETWIRNGRFVNPKNKHRKSGGDLFIRSLALCLISPSASLMRRELYEQMKGFREDFPVCEDYELWLRVTSQYEVGYIETPIIKKYGGHGDQLSQKYKAMDYWRVRAMDELSKSVRLNCEQHRALKNEMLKKCIILEQGYVKHQSQPDRLAYVRQLKDQLSGL